MIKGYWRFGTGVLVHLMEEQDVWFDSEFQGTFKDFFEKHGMPLGVHEIIVTPVGVNPEGQQVSFMGMDGEVVRVLEWRPLK